MTSSMTGGTEFFPARAEIVVPAGMLGPEPSTFDVSAFVVRRGDSIVLVDTLMQPDHVELIRDALSRAGAGFDDIDHIVLTHHHPDHTSGLATVAALAPQARILCGAGDVAAINGSTGVAVDAVGDGEIVGGLEVVMTPGHTLGHLCLFDPSSSTMLLGDVAGYDGSGWQYPPAQFTHDADQAAAALRALVERDFDRALPAHGSPLTSNASASLREFLTGPA